MDPVDSIYWPEGEERRPWPMSMMRLGQFRYPRLLPSNPHERGRWVVPVTYGLRTAIVGHMAIQYVILIMEHA